MSIRCKTCDEKSCAVAVLSDPELELLSGNIAEVNFKKGATLFHEGALNAHVFYLRKGFIKIHKKASEERERILKLINTPAYIGLPTIFGDCINQFSATALSTSTVCVIDIDTFKHLILHNGLFAYKIIEDISRDELDYYQRSVDQSHKQAPGLIAGVLLSFCDHIYKDPCFEIQLTRNEIAQLLGLSRESITRHLSGFKEEGLIDLEKNKISILKPERLRKIWEAG